MYLICHITLQRVKQIYGWEHLVVCHQLDKYCGHKQCDSGNTIFLICYVTSRDFMDGSPSRRVTTFSCLVTVGLVQVKI